MDEIAKYNMERWNALAEAGALWTRPWLGLDADAARKRLDPIGLLGNVANKHVLCLASGGGQQAPAFALLGAKVVSLDLSESQLQRDRETAVHYNVQIETIQGDMRDLSHFEEDTFDIVWHPHSINFVPDAHAVFRQVARILRRDGLYHFGCHNPFFLGLEEKDWNGEGYTLKYPYVEGAELTEDDGWIYYPNPKPPMSVHGTRAYRHTLSILVNSLIVQGFVILHIEDIPDIQPDTNAEPGTWDHFVSIAPPWLAFWTCYSPYVYEKMQLSR